ncbi:hypothetical protein HOH87_01615 [bacterium]|jgi:hypothetical protein|nr:hypothetical protein [bacterium]
MYRPGRLVVPRECALSTTQHGGRLSLNNDTTKGQIRGRYQDQTPYDSEAPRGAVLRGDPSIRIAPQSQESRGPINTGAVVPQHPRPLPKTMGSKFDETQLSPKQRLLSGVKRSMALHTTGPEHQRTLGAMEQRELLMGTPDQSLERYSVTPASQREIYRGTQTQIRVTPTYYFRTT